MSKNVNENNGKLTTVIETAHSVKAGIEGQCPEQLIDNGIADESEWMNTFEAASYLRVSESTLHNLVSNGVVETYKLGRRNRYHRAKLRDFLFSQKGDSDDV